METKPLLKEALQKHKEIKRDLLDLMGKVSTPNVTKDKIKDELFKIYVKLK